MTSPFRADHYHLLVVDDDPNILEVMRLYLGNQGFQVSTATRGEDALRMIRQGVVNLAIVDIMLPDIDGWTLCKKIRQDGDLPILMVTAKGQSADRLRGFALGADDYLAKPFDPNELVARSIALLKRSYRTGPTLPEKPGIRFGEVYVDTLGHVVTVDGRILELSRREYQLLLILAQNPNRILSRPQLLELIWGIDYTGEDRVVDVTVTRLRKKLGTARHRDWEIDTVRGLGYRLKVSQAP